MSELKLKKDEILELIDSYKRNECLWNKKNDSYKKQDVKNKAWDELAAEFNTTREVIKKKVKYLRSAYNAEQKKVIVSKVSTSCENPYKPILFYFNELSFINDSMVFRTFHENISQDFISTTSNNWEKSSTNEEEIFENAANKLELYSEGEDTLIEPSFSESKRRRTLSSNTNIDHNVSSKYSEAIASILESLKHSQEEDDVHTAFGKSVALQLKQLPEMEAAQTMTEVQALLSRKRIQTLQSRVSQNGISSFTGTGRNTSTPVKIFRPCKPMKQ